MLALARDNQLEMMATKWLPWSCGTSEIVPRSKKSIFSESKQHKGGRIRAADTAADGQTKGFHGYSRPTETTGPEGGGATSFLFHLKAHRDKKSLGPVLRRANLAGEPEPREAARRWAGGNAA